MTRTDLIEHLLGKEIETRFVSIREAVALHDRSIATVGGTAGVRDAGLLESALHKPMHQRLFGEDDVIVLAAALADGIVQNHAFLDGNKRTGYLAMMLFLTKNGIDLSPDVAEAVEHFRRLAAHDITADDLAAWLREMQSGDNTE